MTTHEGQAKGLTPEQLLQAEMEREDDRHASSGGHYPYENSDRGLDESLGNVVPLFPRRSTIPFGDSHTSARSNYAPEVDTVAAASPNVAYRNIVDARAALAMARAAMGAKKRQTDDHYLAMKKALESHDEARRVFDEAKNRASRLGKEQVVRRDSSRKFVISDE